MYRVLKPLELSLEVSDAALQELETLLGRLLTQSLPPAEALQHLLSSTSFGNRRVR